MIRMFPAHIPMPQRSDMQVPSRLLDHHTAIQPARFTSLYQRHRWPESGILRPTTAIRPAKDAECEQAGDTAKEAAKEGGGGGLLGGGTAGGGGDYGVG